MTRDSTRISAPHHDPSKIRGGFSAYIAYSIAIRSMGEQSSHWRGQTTPTAMVASQRRKWNCLVSSSTGLYGSPRDLAVLFLASLPRLVPPLTPSVTGSPSVDGRNHEAWRSSRVLLQCPGEKPSICTPPSQKESQGIGIESSAPQQYRGRRPFRHRHHRQWRQWRR